MSAGRGQRRQGEVVRIGRVGTSAGKRSRAQGAHRQPQTKGNVSNLADTKRRRREKKKPEGEINLRGAREIPDATLKKKKHVNESVNWSPPQRRNDVE